MIAPRALSPLRPVDDYPRPCAPTPNDDDGDHDIPFLNTILKERRRNQRFHLHQDVPPNTEHSSRSHDGSDAILPSWLTPSTTGRRI